MDNKLQQKFALVQQMKKEKERKEASRVKDHRSVDIFALAGVNLPTTALALSRQDKDRDKDRDSRHGPLGKRLRVQNTISPTATSTGGPLSPSSSSSNSVTSPRRENEETNTNGTSTTATTTSTTTTTAVVRTETGTEKKLKRSSMAVRNATAASQMHVHRDAGDSSEKMMDNSTYVGRGRNPSVSSMGSPPYTSTSSNHTSDNSHATTATPPTPIPSPRTDPSVQSDNPTYNRPVDNQAGGRRWSASTDNREEIIRTGHAQPPRSTRHQSPDTIADHHSSTRMHPLMDQSGSQESRKRRMDGHTDFGRHPGDYDGHRPRFRSNSRSRSHSPGRQGSFRSRSRSVSPYRDHGPDVYKRRDSARDFDQDDYTHHGQRSSIRRHQDLPSLFTKIRVEGLVDSTSVTALLAAFGPYGEIEEANLVEGKNAAFVKYTRLDAAQRALEMMNGSIVEGAVVRVFREECPMYYQRGSGSEAGTLSPLPAQDGTRRPSLATSTSSASSQGLTTPEAPTTMTTTRPIHQLPPRPRSPKLPPKPVAAVYPPVGADPRAAVAQARGRSRQILSYGDL
ncbi:hypothetical protein BGZ95_005619 [Linnemannia exigua]|uniref:RRM domain-containing protein n=1 Tax=Linnemannia exigua TaxID=604196 RepID=A0AAD4DLN7_9FUNG|nr:hypothetical protein BGZ95_005619 [Linnemannia exigua]